MKKQSLPVVLALVSLFTTQVLADFGPPRCLSETATGIFAPELQRIKERQIVLSFFISNYSGSEERFQLALEISPEQALIRQHLGSCTAERRPQLINIYALIMAAEALLVHRQISDLLGSEPPSWIGLPPPALMHST